MTDLLTQQASIKARNKLVRDRSGQFRRTSVAIELQLAAERMRASLDRDVPAAEHARGVVYERGHFHKLPGYVAPIADDGEAVPHTAEVLPLFERAA